MTPAYSHNNLSGVVKQKKKELRKILNHVPKEYRNASLVVAIETLALSLNQEYISYQDYYKLLNSQLQLVAKKVHDNIGTQFNSREKTFAAHELITDCLYGLLGDKSLEMKLINGKIIF